MLTPARMILCLLRATGLIAALIACIVIKVVLALSLLVGYLAALVLLQHFKAAYLDDAWETLLCLISSEARGSLFLRRLGHLEDKPFHPYYHGRKPSSPVLVKGLSIVCDWWLTQQPSGLPPDVVVYLRLTCKTLHQLEQLAATHLTLKAPLYPSGVWGALNRPARWRRVQAVSYLHHKPEQLQALTLFAPAWPNLRQLRVTRPQYLHLRQQHWDVTRAWVEIDDISSEDGAFALTVQPSAAGSSSNSNSSSSSSSSSSDQKQLLNSSSSSDAAVLHLIAGLVSSAPHWPSLQYLSLSNLGLTPAAAQLLVQAAAQWPLLRCLDVTNNRLGPVGVQILLEAAMQSWQQLEIIDVRGNLQPSSTSASSNSNTGSNSGARADQNGSSCISDVLGLFTGQSKRSEQNGCRRVVLQSHVNPKYVAPHGDAQSVDASSGRLRGDGSDVIHQGGRIGLYNSSSSEHQQWGWQKPGSSSSCRYIPTEGFVARHVYVVL